MSTPPKRSSSNCSFSKGRDEISVKRIQDESQNVEGNRKSFNGSVRSEVSTPDRSVEHGFEESCALRHFSKHKSSHLRFLAWVAYTRKYANDTITDEERRTCPLLWCREKFVDQESMLKHVWDCPELNKGLYWCFPCARSERLGKVHKRCQRLPSRTDRLATVAKRIFSKLGTGNQRKSFNNLSVGGHSLLSKASTSTDRSTSKESRSQGETTNLHCQIQELPDTSIRAEMVGDWTAACQELPDTSIMEMMGSECTQQFGNEADSYPDNFYAETFDDYTPASIMTKDKILAPSLPRLDTTVMSSDDSTGWRNSAQRFPHITPDSWSDGPYDSHIVSPMSAMGTLNGNFDVEISPTDSEASGKSFFSDSGYTSASTQSVLGFSTGSFSRLSSFNKSAGTKRTRTYSTMSKKYPDGNIPIVVPVTFPVSMPQFDEAFAQSVNSSTSVSRSSSNASDKSKAKDFSPHWSDASTLVNCLSEVLEAHVSHSRAALERLPTCPVVSELLAMSMNSMISIGSDAIAGIFEDRLPTTIAQVYAATNFAYACAIVLGHHSDQMLSINWLNETLHWASGLAADTHRGWYTQIAHSIWHPSQSSHDNGPQSQASADVTFGQLLRACRQFLDFFENFDNQQKAALDTTVSTPGFDFAQLSFEFKAKSRVIDKLITMSTIEAFITDVVGVEKKLQQGHIPNTRKLELELMCAAKVHILHSVGPKHADSFKLSSESSIAYDRFLHHVTTLCDELYAEQSRMEPSRAAHHLRDISLLKEHLLAQSPAGHIPDRGDDLMNDFADEQLLFGVDFDFQAASEEVASEVFAFSEEADNILRDFSVSANSLGLSPSPAPLSSLTQDYKNPSSASIASYPKPAPQPWAIATDVSTNTTSSQQIPQSQVAKSAATITHRCHCGYIPTGEEKWKASNLRRHKRVQHAADNSSKKVYRCRWAGCKSVFTRSDNLRSHQRDKGHVPGLGMNLSLGASVGGSGDHNEEEEEENEDEEDMIAKRKGSQESRIKKQRIDGEERLTEVFTIETNMVDEGAQ